MDTSQRVDLSRYTGGPATRPPPQPPPSPDEPPTSAIGWVMGSPRRPPSQPPEPRGRTFRVVFILVVTTVVLVLLGLAAVYAANNWFPG
ncbi:MAG: hypothetical protein ACRDXX_15795 [Stackebrandtia sp.]